jgi:hypothetical protein
VRVFAYCLASTAGSVRRMAGVEPATAPPLVDHRFRPAWLEYRDLVFFKLHGAPGDPLWRGDDLQPALSTGTLVQAKLKGALVFASSCWLPESPMLAALFEAGAAGVVGGRGTNYGGTATMAGADLLGLYWRWGLQLGLSPATALTAAKGRLQLKWPTVARKDTMAFELFTPGGGLI